jgi:hypothetical protein
MPLYAFAKVERLSQVFDGALGLAQEVLRTASNFLHALANTGSMGRVASISRLSTLSH